MLIHQLAMRFRAIGERLRPEYEVLKEGQSPEEFPSTTKLYGPGTPVELV